MEKLCIPSGVDMASATRKRNFAKTPYKLVLILFLTFLYTEGKAQTPLDANLSINGKVRG